MSLQALMALLGHVSAEMSLRYARLFDTTVRAEYERALDLAKTRLGPMPSGRARIPVTADADWRDAPAIKARLAGGYSLRAPAQGACPYANICEHCPNFRTDAASMPSSPPNASTPKHSPPTPNTGAGVTKLTGTDDSSPASTPSSPKPTPHDRQRSRCTSRDGAPTLATADQPITFTAVAEQTGLARATLYRNPTLRVLIDEHRLGQIDTRTLSGLSTEINHLRTALEAVAQRVRGHEERIRHLERRRTARSS